MANVADMSDPYINEVIVAGQERIQKNLAKQRMYPIVLVLDGVRFGVCHWCESPITPGHLFCPKDPLDDGKCCSEMLDHEQKRLKDQGIE